MNKTFIIIKREYLTRVKKRSFIISTFLFPIIMILFVVGAVYLAVKSKETVKIAVANDSFLKSSLKSDSSSVLFEFNPAVNESNFSELGYNGLLKKQDDTAQGKKYRLFSRSQVGSETMSQIKDQLNRAMEENMFQQRGISSGYIDSVNEISRSAIRIDAVTVDKSGNQKQANAGLANVIGLASGFLIYITMFIFGAMVMRGVMEEKMNRIAEVIVSSVKPFQLMMGKIIGIAAVGLTQFLMWIILIFALFSVVQLFIPSDAVQNLQQAQQSMPNANSSIAMKIMEQKDYVMSGVNLPLIIICFLFYFLGGYFFYAALFAAVGSVVNEDPQEAQSLMMPIMMPIILSFIILSSSIGNPNSPLSFWGSMIPFTSPIIMMGRVATGVPETVPYWQLFLSMALLILGFLGTTWFAGKVYRTGILLYGKRITWKEMMKWLRRSS